MMTNRQVCCFGFSSTAPLSAPHSIQSPPLLLMGDCPQSPYANNRISAFCKPPYPIPLLLFPLFLFSSNESAFRAFRPETPHPFIRGRRRRTIGSSSQIYSIITPIAFSHLSSSIVCSSLTLFVLSRSIFRSPLGNCFLITHLLLFSWFLVVNNSILHSFLPRFFPFPFLPLRPSVPTN